MKKIRTAHYAEKRDNSLAGTYVASTAVYCRDDAGADKKALCVIPKGTEVKCYGYYSTADTGRKWLLVQFTLDGVQYTGFVSAAYLKKE